MQEIPRLYVSDFLDGLYNKPHTNTFVTFWYQNYKIIFLCIFTVAPIIVPGNVVDEQKEEKENIHLPKLSKLNKPCSNIFSCFLISLFAW